MNERGGLFLSLGATDYLPNSAEPLIKVINLRKCKKSEKDKERVTERESFT